MQDWNVVVTAADRLTRFHAVRGLKQFGKVGTTEFHNVLVMQVGDVGALMASLVGRDMSLINDISRLIRAAATFNHLTKEDSEERARAIIFG